MIEENLGKAKYDKETLMQMRLIEIEKRLEKLAKTVEHELYLSQIVGKEVLKRIETLERIRRVQIVTLSDDAESRIKVLEGAGIELLEKLEALELGKKPSLWQRIRGK